MTDAIVVCPLSRLPETLAGSGARSVVTLLVRGRSASVPRLPDLRHLVLEMSDIAIATEGHVLPARGHVAAFLAFVRTWDRRAPMLLHCHAGVSRSTAAAFTAFCALRPDADEVSVAARLRGVSPAATPNPRFIALADAALGREGRMVEAVRRIGRGRDCFEGDVFRLDLSD